jgi:hypothetical protein
MKRPQNIINPKDYDKPQSFEKDWDAEIYYSYIEAQKYIDYLESEVKKNRIYAVSGSVCTCLNAKTEKYSQVPVYCHNCKAYVQTNRRKAQNE